MSVDPSLGRSYSFASVFLRSPSPARSKRGLGARLGLRLEVRLGLTVSQRHADKYAVTWEESYMPVRPVHSLDAPYVVARVVLGECTITAMFSCSVGPGMLDMVPQA